MANRSAHVAKTLQFFYDNPIAAVSLELFLTTGLVLFLAVAAIRPTLLTMSELLKEIEDKRTLNEKLTQKVASLATAQTEYLSYEPRLFVLDQAIPTNPEVVQALKIIEKIVSEQKIIITSIAINEIPDDDESGAFEDKKVVMMPMTIALTGDYLSIRKFVEAIKANRRNFVVDTVVFSAEEDKGEKTLRARVTLSLPYFGKPVVEAVL